MWIYYLIINIIGYGAMCLDKKKAVHHRYRISEQQLWLIAICLGAFGMCLGMWQFHHKSRKWCFQYGLPLLTIIEWMILIL